MVHTAKYLLSDFMLIKIIKLQLTSNSGSVELTISTEPLQMNLTKDLVTSTPEKMEPGITLTAAAMAQSYTILLTATAK